MRIPLTLLWLAIAAPTFAQWTPPVGIPAPSFGLNEIQPAITKTVSALPATLVAGDVVQLTGTSTGGTVTASCTQAKPCWLIGTGASLHGYTVLAGQYLIAVNLHVSGAYHSLELAGSHLACRGCVSTGDPSEGNTAGLVISGTNDIFWHWLSENHGTLTPGTDTDAHGASVVRGAKQAYFVDGESRFNAGDGLNCNSYPYDASGFTAIDGVYFARNYLHDNKQTGQWCKQSRNVVVSQNEIANSKSVDAFSYGQCAGYQYSTDLIWFLYNNIHDCAVGIGVSSDDVDPAPATHAFFLANRLANITVPDPNVCGTGGPWPCAVIRLTNAGTDYVLDNVVVTSTEDALHATAGKLDTNIAGVIVSEDTAVPGTPAAAYAAFKTQYGLDITGGVVPANGTVGLGSSTPAPTATPTPTAAPTPSPKPTPAPKPVLPPCGPGLSGWINWLLGKCK